MKKTNLKLPESNFFIDEAYKVLRTNLQFCGEDIKVITVTSCNENEGKTTTVVNLAKEFSDLEKKVLVIDADMRKSVMAIRHSDATNIKGLSELLSGLAKKEECIYNTQYTGYDIIFSGWTCPNPVELLNGASFKALIKWARENYDYVIIDTPPLGIVIDAAVIGPLTDGVTILMSYGVKYSTANAVIEQLEKSGSKILGLACNQINNKKNAKKTYYKYGYSDGDKTKNKNKKNKN